MKKTLLLIDSHALIHRAFHALPPLTTPNGEPIGAVYGLARILIKTLKEKRPDYVVATFDRPEETHRRAEYKEYKAHREKAPDELISQFAIARNLFKTAGIPVVDYAGFEADDIIGTLSTLSDTHDVIVTILTGDMDSLQLIKDGRVVVEAPQKGVSETKIFDEAAVFEKLGIYPNHVVDYKGLVGDTSDNIPGIPGVGPKTALKLLSEFDSVEDIFEKMGTDHPLAKKVLENKDVAMLSKKLSTIHRDVPIDKNIDAFVYHPIEESVEIKNLFQKLGFKNMFPETPIRPDKKNIESKFSPIPILSFSYIPKKWGDDAWFVAFSWKEIIKEFLKDDIEPPKRIFDVSLLFWLLNPDSTARTYKEIAHIVLGKECEEQTDKDLLDLFEILIQKIEKENLFSVYEKYEMPLIPLLATMEARGIAIDTTTLNSLKIDLKNNISALEKKIYALSGKEFNIASPKQVGEILDSLGCFSKTRKTKTGQIKTDKETLESIADAHPVINDILVFREYSKLLSGFVEPLSVYGENGIIHTTFLQTGTGTGRLSSLQPNMQNIPQESEWSERIRSAFIPREGFEFLSFDYSQLELRLLAHASGDKTLIQAFKDGADIHAITASKIFGKDIKTITKQERRIGKTLNFGIIYGMGPRAFAKTSGISFEEANHFMTNYFNLFPNVKTWQEEIKNNAKINGFVENIHGRKRWFAVERFGEYERAIINMPLQSLGADIIKQAMISVSKYIATTKLGDVVFPILTIHDELLLEVRHDMINTIRVKIKEIMEGVENISIPLVVETKHGLSWGKMK